MKEINLYLLAIIASVIIGKGVLKVQSDILLFLIVSIFFCAITFILCFIINKEKEDKPELTDKIKKERKKFLILEGLMWIVIIAEDFSHNYITEATSALLLPASAIHWVKFIQGPYTENIDSMYETEVWLYFCGMPIIFATQYTIWLINTFSSMFHH